MTEELELVTEMRSLYQGNKSVTQNMVRLLFNLSRLDLEAQYTYFYCPSSKQRSLPDDGRLALRRCPHSLLDIFLVFGTGSCVASHLSQAHLSHEETSISNSQCTGRVMGPLLNISNWVSSHWRKTLRFRYHVGMTQIESLQSQCTGANLNQMNQQQDHSDA